MSKRKGDEKQTSKLAIYSEGRSVEGARVYQPLVIVAKNEWRKESSGTFDALMSCWRDHYEEMCGKCVGLFSNMCQQSHPY